MNFENEMKKKILQNDFARNNGRVLRTINILNGKFIGLDGVCTALNEYMNLGEFEESLIYLLKSCYIEIRTKSTHKILDELSRYTYLELEACLTQKGIKMARGFIEDEAVEI